MINRRYDDRVAINLRRARVLPALMPPVCQVPSKAAKDVMT
jgi:hypothetical protein